MDASSSSVRRARYRDRREKMENYYNLLHSMAQRLPKQATKARILDETINCIKSLQETCAVLELRKAMMQQQTETGTSMSVTISGNKTSLFELRAIHRRGLLTQVNEVFHKHRAKVLAAMIVRPDDNYIDITVTAAFMDEDEVAKERIRAELIALQQA